MRGSIKWQVQEVYKMVDRIGESRHAAKNDVRAAGARTSAQVAEKTGIHSFRTKEAYQKVWRQVMDHAKAEFRIRDIEKLNAEHVSSFLRSRIDTDVARQTYGQATAALGKLENALNAYAQAKGTDQVYSFRPAMQAMRQEAAGLVKMTASRAFREPERVIAALRDPDHQLAATIQRESGCRAAEATLIRASQLREGGKIEIRGKGGKVRELEVSRQTAGRLAERMTQAGGEFRVSIHGYISAVRRASEEVNDRGGTHSFRHRWAQDRMQEKLDQGKSFERALAEISREIGHERAEITLHYLGRR